MTRPATTNRRIDLRDEVAACYDRSVGDVFRWLYRATAGNRRLSEDLTQETFLACVRAAAGGDERALTAPWLMVVARHKLIDHVRLRSREERKLALVWNETGDRSSTRVVDLTDDLASTALRQLSAPHRLVLLLRYVDDLPVADVAQLIGKSLRATESLLVRARHALDAALKELSDDRRS